VHDEIDPDSRHRRERSERSLCLDYFCAHLSNDNSLANEPTSNVIFGCVPKNLMTGDIR